jgi:anthranilate phosphoribosyltransferase
MSFDAKPYLREIARGQHSARDLTREQAATLFAAVFAGEVADLPLGAVLVAYRVKGESAEELAGMLEALEPHLQSMRLPSRRAIPVVLPTYNGSRKLPNLVPLLALLLAREGVPVLLHGASHEPQRVCTFEILAELGHPPVESLAEAEARLDERLLAPVPIALLSAPLARLLDARLQTGVRNTAHTLAKLMLPRGVASSAASRLISVTHPDFQKLLRALFAGKAANVFLMRGVEGEAVVRLHAPQPIEQIGLDGKIVTHLIGDGEAEVELPAREAPLTAAWIRRVLDGKAKVPSALARQVALVSEHCHAIGAAARPALKLVK